MNKSRKLDQFYTKESIAVDCYQFLNKYIDNSYLFLEPSAGSGAFYNLFPSGSRIGLDIEPKHSEVLNMDFFNFAIENIMEEHKHKKIITVGNPPFGKNSSLAIKFINHAAIFSDYIAFILPKTFNKDSIVNKINSNIHLIAQFELPKNSFIFDGESYDVPCIFQIWEKRITKRKKINKPVLHKDFIFTDKDNADFAIRRVGGLAGKVIVDYEKYSPASHYYIKAVIGKEKLLKKLNSIDWSSVKYNTAGNPSISKRELIELYSNVI